MLFGDRFRAVLRERGLTQTDAARLLEMKQATVSYYCNLEGSPRPRILRHMAERLGVTVAALTGEKGMAGRGGRRVGKAPTPAQSRSGEPYDDAMKRLKARWRRRSNERDTIRHLIGALFPESAAKILAWLEEL